MSRAQLTSTVEQNTGGAVAPLVAGKNKIINGAMDWAQRGTSFTASAVYGLDRWYMTSGAQFSCTQSTSAPTGFRYSTKLQRPSGTDTSIISIAQALETSTSIPLAGQTTTLSFYAKAGANFAGTAFIRYYYGTGTDQGVAGFGSWTGYTEVQSSGTFSPTTSWARYSITGVFPSTATQIGVRIGYIPTGTAGADESLYITGVQVEAGPVATPFTTASGTLQGELALCQRYYYSLLQDFLGGSGGVVTLASSQYSGSSYTNMYVLPVPMRVAPSVTFGTSTSTDANATWYSTTTSSTLATGSLVQSARALRFTTTSATAYGLCNLTYLQVSAEL